jgi:PmbA protein
VVRVIHEVVERALRVAGRYGLDEVEVYAVRSSATDVIGTIRGLERVTSGERVDVGVRVVLGKRVTVQGGMVSRVEDVDPIVEAAAKVVRTLPEDPNWVSLPRKTGRTSVEGVIDPKLRSPDVGYFIEVVRYLLGRARDIDKRAYTSSASVRSTYVERVIVSSHGGPQVDEHTEVGVSVSIKAVDGTEESGYYEFYSATTLSRFNPEELVSRAVEVSVKTLGARRVDTGTYEVVLVPRVFANVIQALLVPAVSAESVQRGRSPLAGKLGGRVLSESLTIVDDGTYPELTGTRSFDDEGVPTSKKIVFDRGTLREYLYDTYTAYIDRRESTGNAFRQTPYSPPTPWITNILVEPGSGDLQSMVRDLRRGIVVYSTIGEWLSNPVSGLLNATVTNGMYVEGGEERFPVKGVVIAGNIYEAMGSPEVGLTATVESFARFRVPAVYIPKLTVAGK